MNNCANPLQHKIKQGDNLYHIAKHYQTTVPMILSQNPGIDPYNLKIDSTITVCPGKNFVAPNNPPSYQDFSKELALSHEMRLLWSQHVYWTRMLLISIAERLADQSAAANRLLRNPKDIAGLFADYYSAGAAQTIDTLLTDHLQIGGALITALRDGQTSRANELNRQWYINADKMAEAFSGINPYYDQEEIREMLYEHLDLTKQEAAARLAGNYQADIEAFDKVELEAMSMADTFTSGLIKQFPQKFT